MLFDSGIAVDGATGVGKYDGNINIKYINEMSEITTDNFALYKKTPSAYDSTYTLVENGFSLSEDGSVISLPNLEASTKYRLWMNGLKNADGTVMDDDFVEFTTADSLELLTSVVEGISFANGSTVPAAGIHPELCGDLTINFKEAMNTETLTNTNIVLEKVTDDGAEAIEYTATASETAYVIDYDSMNVEPGTTYRLKFKTDIKTAGRNHLSTDEIYEFSTRNSYIYKEDFNDTPDSALWTKTKGSYDGEHSRTGKSSYMYANGTKLDFTVGESHSSKVYEVWMYYQKDSSENKQIKLSGTNSAGISKTVTISAFTGAKILINNANTSKKISVGWNKFVVDTTTPTATKIYLNGTLIKTLDETASLATVTTYTLESGANSSYVWFDDFKIYNSYSDVPASKSEVLESVLLDSGIAVDGATGVGKYDGNINIKYINEMSEITADNFALYKKTPSADDSTYTLVENGFTLSENGTVISLPNLEASTKYRLWMNGFECTDGTVMDNDFIEFTTAENINLLTSVTDDISFENGITVPTKGIPSEMCGDLTVTFKEAMNTDTLTNSNIVLEKVTDDGTESIAYTATASETAYVIDYDSMNLELSSTYRLTFKTDILTAGRNYLSADEVYEFSTSSNGVKQEPAATDDFEVVSGEWTINPTAVENAHSGSSALSLDSAESATYTGTFIANGVYEVWFYDTLSSSDSILLQLEGENEQTVMFGIKDGVADKYWLTDDVLVGNRTEGWHRFIVDFTNPSQVGYYIDDVLVAERSEAFDKVTGISICNLTSTAAMMADDFKIWNLMDYVVIAKVMEATAFICDENYNSVSSYTAGDEVYIALEVDNQQEISQDAVLLVGEYLGGVLTNVIPGSSDTFEPFESAYLKANYTIPENFANYELKAFCWDSVLTMKPLMPVSIPNEVKVSFDMNYSGAKVHEVQTMTIGDKASEPDEPTRSGHSFGGWFTDAECTTEYDFDTAVTSDMTVYANWIAFKYTQTSVVTTNIYTGYDDFYAVAEMDAIVPAQSESPVPQGLAYREDTNQYYISAYDCNKTDSSVIMVVDAATGEYVGEYYLKNSDGENYMGHVGGIAVTENEVFVTDGQGIYRIALSQIDELGTNYGDLYFEPIVKTSLNGASASFCNYSDGILWLGNFYLDGDDYGTKAYGDYKALAQGYVLDENGGFKESAMVSDQTFDVIPDFVVEIPASIQGMTIIDGKMVLSKSYGRLYDSALRIGKNPILSEAVDTITLNEKDIPVYEFLEEKSIAAMPMSEGLDTIGEKIVLLFESGAKKYREGGGVNPTDRLWLVDIE